MIFVDSNIPMYLVGAPHPNKGEARLLLERCVSERERLITDAEVLQEILHLYTAIDRRDAIAPTFEALLSVVDEVLPIELETATRARELVLAVAGASARDAIHVAAMERRGIQTVMTFDRGFDAFPSVRRLT